MKLTVAALLIAAIVCAHAEDNNLRGDAQELDHPHTWDLLGHSKTMDGVIELWHKFVNFFERSYSDAEREVRLLTFKHNLEFINKYNSMNKSAKLGITPFADMTFEEFSEKFLLKDARAAIDLDRATPHQIDASVEKETEVDWVEKNAVTPVKNQGMCGSCWAFSTISAVESHNYLKNGKLVSLSEQELVDCAGSHYQNHGCQGGLYTHALDFVEDNGGISTEDDYPYICAEGEDDPKCAKASCHAKGLKKTAKVKSYVQCQSEAELEDAVSKKGPVSIAVQVTPVFQHYTSGVLDDEDCGEQLNHAIVAVGYGEVDGEKTWKVRNSWGPSWGEKGYINMKRGINQCGLALIPVYPVMD